MKCLILLGVICLSASYAGACTVTTASGTRAWQGFCSGQLIFEDNFDNLDESKWRHEMTMAGGGNYEFQWYVNSRFNSYTTGGNLHLKPTFTSDIYGEDFLRNGRAIIPPNECTDSSNWGCDRTASWDNIINPIRSARLTTWDSFAFKYGTLEIRAKMPAGDWLWPALWLMPRQSVYGEWPRSGEIDLSEFRSNRNLFNGNTNVGIEQHGSTIHFGPFWNVNGWPTSHQTKNRSPGFNHDFHLYKLVWTPTEMNFLVDNELVLHIPAGTGFWDRGGFWNSGHPNPWAGASVMAPFDQEFFVIMNVAAGGTAYFADGWRNEPYPKPWSNASPRAAADFWEHRHQWEPTWNMQHTDDSHLQVDYVRIWAL